MGRAIPYDYRVKIVKKIESGQNYAETAEEFGYSESGIKKIWYAYKKQGAACFTTKYGNCGRISPYQNDVRNLVNKIRDNQQGATYVYSKLKVVNPDLPVPSARTLTRWWVKEQTNRVKGRPKDKEKKIGV